MIDIKQIKPKLRGKSDKYSWNIYQYVKKNNMTNVYWYRKTMWTNTIINFTNRDKTKALSSHFYIGCIDSDGRIMGNRINNIMKNSKDRFTVFSFHPFGGWKSDDFEDVTEWFWENYVKYGRCLFDPEHKGWWANDESRFAYVNNTRKCNWCGQWQKKEIIKKVKINRKEIWRNE